MLRDSDRSAARRNAAIKSRLNALLNGDYKVLTQRWRNDIDIAVTRKRTPRPETKGRRLALCLKFFYHGFISRGLGVYEGFVKYRSTSLPPSRRCREYIRRAGNTCRRRREQMAVATSQTLDFYDGPPRTRTRRSE